MGVGSWHDPNGYARIQGEAPLARFGAEDRPPPPPSPRRPRRWPWIVVGIVLIGALGTTSTLTWINYQAAENWREQANAAEADVERLQAENGTLEQDLADVREALEDSETDVRSLERRVSRAANEAARAADEREAANAMVERLNEVALAYDNVAEWFRDCRAAQSDLTSMVLNFESYYFANQTYLIDGQIDTVADICGTAEQYLFDLRSYVVALTSQ